MPVCFVRPNAHGMGQTTKLDVTSIAQRVLHFGAIVVFCVESSIAWYWSLHTHAHAHAHAHAHTHTHTHTHFRDTHAHKMFIMQGCPDVSIMLRANPGFFMIVWEVCMYATHT